MVIPYGFLYESLVCGDVTRNFRVALHCILLYRLYVYDCFSIVKRDQINNIIITFNHYNKHLQFTVETESNNKISFSVIEISRVDNNLPLTNWYRKNPASGRYINFLFYHPLSQKIAIIYNLINKCMLLAHPSFHRQSINFVLKSILELLNYPAEFIDEYNVASRLKVVI